MGIKTYCPGCKTLVHLTSYEANVRLCADCLEEITDRAKKNYIKWKTILTKVQRREHQGVQNENNNNSN